MDDKVESKEQREVIKLLKPLRQEQLEELAMELGLRSSRVQGYGVSGTQYITKLVGDWTNESDDVISRGGCTWCVLEDALKEIGADGIAKKVVDKRASKGPSSSGQSSASGGAKSGGASASGRQDELPDFTDLMRFVMKGGDKMNIAAEIPPEKSQELCADLLNDRKGNKFQAIDRGKAQGTEVNSEILRKWVNESARKQRTWRRLVEVLKDIGCVPLAEDIEDVVGECN